MKLFEYDPAVVNLDEHVKRLLAEAYPYRGSMNYIIRQKNDALVSGLETYLSTLEDEAAPRYSADDVLLVSLSNLSLRDVDYSQIAERIVDSLSKLMPNVMHISEALDTQLYMAERSLSEIHWYKYWPIIEEGLKNKNPDVVIGYIDCFCRHYDTLYYITSIDFNELPEETRGAAIYGFINILEYLVLDPTGKAREPHEVKRIEQWLEQACAEHPGVYEYLPKLLSSRNPDYHWSKFTIFVDKLAETVFGDRLEHYTKTAEGLGLLEDVQYWQMAQEGLKVVDKGVELPEMFK